MNAGVVPPIALPPIALTMGEPAGIGGEITLKAWHSRQAGTHPFFVIDDPARLTALAERVGLRVPIVEIDEPEAAAAEFAAALPVLGSELAVNADPGRPDPANVPTVIAAIDQAVALTREGRAAATVTNPIHKATMYEGGFAYPGHTEYLGAIAGGDAPPQMMLAVPGLRVVPVTVHLPLADVAGTLTSDMIVAAGRATAEALRRDFAIAAPRLVVAALNPHAGEAGALGAEERAIINPAIETLRADGIEVSGPAPADTLFHARARATYDAALCMYHDQALIPLKTIDFDHGVNITLGLPFIRTSPDHGTALALAGTGEAIPTSLIAALTMAGEMASRRRAHGDARVAD
ncbi:MAG: 4-hydroxythreonine-4-phosphate dehydrogenase PdxA [Alphaproteobacteria bacterium]|nr:4-hydroxythreonine-4-phosphate dehydrogenase PdxA [Alphaproteobacteria bacterium]